MVTNYLPALSPYTVCIANLSMYNSWSVLFEAITRLVVVVVFVFVCVCFAPVSCYYLYMHTVTYV